MLTAILAMLVPLTLEAQPGKRSRLLWADEFNFTGLPDSTRWGYGIGAGFEAWPFDRCFHFIFNIAVGGNWGGAQGVDPNIWPQRMEIDYVRVYE